MNMKTYIEFYNFWKNLPLDYLDEIRLQISQQSKCKLNSLKLEVLDDLGYLKYYNIPL
jgi:hypothetical protein